MPPPFSFVTVPAQMPYTSSASVLIFPFPIHPHSHTLPGIGMFVCTYIYMVVWVYTGEVNAKRIREKYLQAILRQDIAYFDSVGAGEVATRIQTDTRMSLSALLPPLLSLTLPFPQISYSKACPKKSLSS